eukprot:TRINITY_DN4747_c0_g5_i1.p1 TRINITY_DN4747_c0_g5~~TRINITY_DN4747_c0_g5_i1.p1  ORF type:complete len:616 (-),score=50.12 TRINITY_DN4747_c0_g5_i1:384-2231(-)
MRLISFACLTSLTGALYLPGVHPNEYVDGDIVELKVNKLTSSQTQLPYDFYDLPFCRPREVVANNENLGEILAGDKIQNSDYNIRMRENMTCKPLCKVPLTPSHVSQFTQMIDEGYMVNWMVDNLPGATRTRSVGSTEHIGFPIGFRLNGHYHVHNHVTLVLMYHSQPNEYAGYRIVGFQIEPFSITQAIRLDPASASGWAASCSGKDARAGFDIFENKEIFFTYDVLWNESPLRWASRWDAYLKVTGGKVHWFSIIYSLLIVLSLSGLIGVILLRTIHRDIIRYNVLATEEETREDTGWKLVHGDVFRRPRFSKLLAVCVGTGCQILGMSVVTLFFALFGLVSPAHRGALLQSMMLLYAFMGVLAGYVASRLYKMFNGEDWKLMTIQTAFLFPGIFFSIFFVLNLFIWGEKSSGAVPFGTMFEMLILWFGISVPLSFVGSYAGVKAEVIELPVRTNQVAREIPPQPWYMNVIVTCSLSAIAPFGAVFTELFFVLSSIWQHQFYYLFGFLGIVLVILVVMCAETSVAVTYLQLSSENYHWWWQSFFSSGFSAVYVFLYGVHYFCKQLAIEKFVSIVLYFGYTLLMSIIFFLLTGSVGMLSSLLFCRSIYGSIKVD